MGHHTQYIVSFSQEEKNKLQAMSKDMPHLGHAQPESRLPKSLSHESSSEVILPSQIS